MRDMGIQVAPLAHYEEGRKYYAVVWPHTYL